MDWITKWQNQLLTLEGIGQQFTPGQQPLNPMTTSHEFRFNLTPSADSDSFRLSLIAHDGGDGDGSANEGVIWKNPRLVGPGLVTISLRDVGRYFSVVTAFRERTLARTKDYLAAVAEAAVTRQVSAAGARREQPRN